MLDQWLVNSVLDHIYIENIKLLGYYNFKRGKSRIFKYKKLQEVRSGKKRLGRSDISPVKVDVGNTPRAINEI